MTRPLLALALAALALSTLSFTNTGRQRGSLVLFGGDAAPDDGLIEALALTEAVSPNVLIIPQASSADDRGQEAVAMWRKLGVNAKLLEPLDRRDAHAMLEACDLIWFSDGSSQDLMRRLAKHALVSKVTSLYGQGKVIAAIGDCITAAGVITLLPSETPQPLVSSSGRTTRGLGLWPTGMVENRFLERDRYANLLSAVLKKPRQLGVGVGDEAALIVQGNELRVVGEGQVVIFDARQADVTRVGQGERQTGRGVQLHVLRGGDSWVWLE